MKCSEERHFLCQIASTESRRPVGLFTNLAWVKSQMAPGYKVDNNFFTTDLSLDDVLNDASRADPRHGWSSYVQFQHLGVGGPSHTCPSPSMSLLLRLTFLFFLAGLAPLSLCGVWARGSLSRSFFTEHAGASSAADFFFGSWTLATILDSATSLTSARFPTLSSSLVRTWIWRGQLQLHGLLVLRKDPW